MADVFKTIVSPAAIVDEARVLAAGALSFLAQRTTDPTGNPPATHYMSSGYIPQDIADSFVADGRYTVSDEKWEVVQEQMLLYPVTSDIA